MKTISADRETKDRLRRKCRETAPLEQFSLLLGALYDTVLDPGLWTDALQRVAAFLQASFVVLIEENVIAPDESRFMASDAGSTLVARYLDGFMLLNPARMAMAGHVQVGDIVLTSDYIPRAEYQQTRFYREFLDPSGHTDVAASIVERNATCITVLSALRSHGQGPADDEVRRRIGLVAPHVRRASGIGTVLDKASASARSLAGLVDRMTGCVVILGPGGAVLHVNDAGRLELADGRVVELAAGRIAPRQATARTALEAALAAAALGDAGPEDGGAPIAFAGLEGRMMTGVVIPLQRGARQAMGRRHGAVAALFLREMRFEMPDSMDTLATLYRLTRRETAVLGSIVRDGGVTETARGLGMAEETVRTHLRAIFRKTGLGRQSDLVKLLSASATPFRG